MFKFDSDTFKLSSALLSGIGFPFVGIMLIIISTILGLNDEASEESKATKQHKVVSKNLEETTQDENVSSRSVQTENESLENLEESSIDTKNNVNLENK